MIVVILWAQLLLCMVATPFLVGLGWRSAATAGAKRPVFVPRVLLTLESLSYLWFLALLFFARTVAPDYTDLRFRTIYANLVAVVGVGVVGCLRGGRERALLLWAAGLLTALWLYALAMSSVV